MTSFLHPMTRRAAAFLAAGLAAAPLLAQTAYPTQLVHASPAELAHAQNADTQRYAQVVQRARISLD